jgi:hypothetical protein
MNELQPQSTGEPATGRVYWRVAEMAHKRGLVSRTGRTPGRPCIRAVMRGTGLSCRVVQGILTTRIGTGWFERGRPARRAGR